MSAQAADALMSIFGFERATLRDDVESGTTEAHELEVVMSYKIIQDHEEWFKTTYPATYRDAKEGRDFDALCHFDHSLAGWQASRAALVVELPSDRKIRHMPTPGENESYNEALENCRNAIHAAGVSTK